MQRFVIQTPLVSVVV